MSTNSVCDGCGEKGCIACHRFGCKVCKKRMQTPYGWVNGSKEECLAYWASQESNKSLNTQLQSETPLQTVQMLSNTFDGIHPVGRKDDFDKLRYDLLPDESVEDIVKVLTFGAKKYAPDNWRQVADWRARYYAALQRHLAAWRKGEKTDPESGLPHLAHAGCCLLFLSALDR